VAAAALAAAAVPVGLQVVARARHRLSTVGVFRQRRRSEVHITTVEASPG